LEAEKVPEVEVAADAALAKSKDDRLRRTAFANRIASTIAERRDPTTIIVGIYGAWGEGKTTVLNFIEERLHTEHPISVITMRFNPWRFTSETALIESFFLSLAEALGGSIKKKSEKIGSWLKKYGGALAPPITIAGVGVDGKQIAAAGAILSSVSLDDYKRRIQDLLKEEGKRVVVFIDDIDRLDKTEVQLLFKLVKLTADFDYVSYVLAFDPQIVAGMLAEQYPGAAAEPGLRFLEKIVQVPLWLPKTDPLVLRQICFQEVDSVLRELGIELADDQANKFAYLFSQGLQAGLTTPRMSKLYTNKLLFSIPLVASEVNIVDFMLVEGIGVFYPNIYSSISDNRDVYLKYSDGNEEKEAWGAEKKKALMSLTREQRRAAQNLLKALFPRAEGQGYGGGWEKTWSADKRVCSSRYFDRYFHYAVPEGDFADSDVDQILSAANAVSPTELATSIQSLVTGTNAEHLLYKLSGRSEDLDPKAAACLAKAIVLSADKFPSTRNDLVTTRRRAAWLVDDLIRGIADSTQRSAEAVDLVSIANSIPMLAEVGLRLMRVPEGEDSATLTKKAEAIVVNKAATRIEELIVGVPPLWEAAGEDAHTVLWAWKKWHEAAQKVYMLEKLKGDPDSALSLLDSYTGTAWGGELGLPFKDDFEPRDYARLSEVVDPVVVYKCVIKLYPALRKGAKYDGLDKLAVRERIANQFVWLHQGKNKTPVSDEEKPEKAEKAS
jgi:hypothetical protein